MIESFRKQLILLLSAPSAKRYSILIKKKPKLNVSEEPKKKRLILHLEVQNLQKDRLKNQTF